jgi:hypothetical protein
MSNCSQHKKEVAGISDMKELANLIGDLHYESLTELLGALAEKISMDGHKDEANGRMRLSQRLYTIAGYLCKASIHSSWAWKISEPYMQFKEATPESYDGAKLTMKDIYELQDKLRMEVPPKRLHVKFEFPNEPTLKNNKPCTEKNIHKAEKQLKKK